MSAEKMREDRERKRRERDLRKLSTEERGKMQRLVGIYGWSSAGVARQFGVLEEVAQSVIDAPRKRA
jgi:hypothetical protein